jgi:hypothetical protein
MGSRNVRAFLAVAIVGVFMFITGFMAIFPLVTKVQIGLNEYADFFAKTASVYTGIVGVIVGYYFGRARQDGRPAGSEVVDKAQS